MGKTDMDKVRKKQAEHKREAYKIPEGETLLYICPPAGDSGLPFVEYLMHYGYNSEGGGSALCLSKNNPIFEEEEFMALVKEANKSAEDNCSVCETFVETGKGDLEAQTRWAFNVVPMRFRQSKKLQWLDIEPECVILPCGYTVWDGIVDAMTNEGDITLPDAAVLVRVTRKGSSITTKYKVEVDTASAKKPIKLSKALKAMVREAQEKSANMFKYVLNFMRPNTELKAQMEGMQVEEEAESDAGEAKKGSEPPKCLGVDLEVGDSECMRCDYLKACADKAGVKLDGEADQEPEEPEEAKSEEPAEPEGEESNEEIAKLQAALDAAKKKQKQRRG